MVDEFDLKAPGLETGTRSIIATSPGAAWAAHSGALVRVDMETGRMTSAHICTLQDLNAVAVLGSSVWLTCLDSLGDDGSVQGIGLRAG